MGILKDYVSLSEESKYSTPEKPQWRVKLGDNYFTIYSDSGPTPNALVECEIPDGKKYIKNWRYLNEDEAPPANAPTHISSHLTTPTPAQLGVAMPFKPVDQSLSIMTQTAFKALMENASDNIEHDIIMDYAMLSARVARYWDKSIRAYMSGGEPRDAIKEEPEAEAAEQATSAPPAPDEFEDEIPF